MVWHVFDVPDSSSNFNYKIKEADISLMLPE